MGWARCYRGPAHPPGLPHPACGPGPRVTPRGAVSPWSPAPPPALPCCGPPEPGLPTGPCPGPMSAHPCRACLGPGLTWYSPVCLPRAGPGTVPGCQDLPWWTPGSPRCSWAPWSPPTPVGTCQVLLPLWEEGWTLVGSDSSILGLPCGGGGRNLQRHCYLGADSCLQ